MNRDELERAEALFHEARQLEPGERRAFLERSCIDDPELQIFVERLLESEEGSVADALSRGFSAVLSPTTRDDPGTRIGPYRLVRRLGEGGMGTVYLAERDDEAFNKRVAIKLVRSGVSSPVLLERFRSERQVLANLEHPNIARLLDGGSTDDGVPYLVMEYVEGLAIDDYCERHGLSIDARLQLFRKVCAAVHDAHRNLVVHRDIKPSNILVGDDGEPKLLDFGIAKVLEANAGDAAVQTTVLAAAMTPRYASPEQIRGERVTTATDVYSLGATLFELLTGRGPYEVANASRTAYEQAIQEQTPLRPSTAAHKRGVNLSGVRRLRGDLDTIVLTALEKEPRRRYASVEQLSQDIQRHLDGLPLLAKPAGWIRRSVMMARRNRRALGAAVAGSILALLVASAAVLYAFVFPDWAARDLRRAQQRLLSPATSNGMYNLLFFRAEGAVRVTILQPGIADQALAAYDDALRWQPWSLDLRLERDVVEAARATAAAPHLSTDPPRTIARHAPLTRDYINASSGGGSPDLDHAALRSASSGDLRSLGLYAVLIANFDHALAAWTELDLVSDPDPFIEGYLGLLHLIEDQPARAYPRLRAAQRAYPDAGYLCVHLAEAALRCGDLDKAEDLLLRARDLDQLETAFAGYERVVGQLDLASGRVEEADERFEWIRSNAYNPVAMLHYGRSLESRGKLREALSVYAASCIDNHVHRIHSALVPAAERWWSSLSAADRASELRSVDELDPANPGSLLFILRAYADALMHLRRMGAEPAAAVEHNAREELGHASESLRVHDLYKWWQRTSRHAPPLPATTMRARADKLAIGPVDSGAALGVCSALGGDVAVVASAGGQLSWPWHDPSLISRATESFSAEVQVHRRGLGGWRLEQRIVSDSSVPEPVVAVSIDGDRLASLRRRKGTGSTDTLIVQCHRRRTGVATPEAGSSTARPQWLPSGRLVFSIPSSARVAGDVIIGADQLLVGLPYDPSGGREVGVVHVYEPSGDAGLDLRQIIRPPDGRSGDLFGSSLAIDGSRLAIGALGQWQDDTGGAYVYRLEAGEWEVDAKLMSGSRGEEARVVFDLDVSGDAVAIGSAVTSRSGASRKGVIHVYRREPNGAWEEKSVLEPPIEAGGGRFSIRFGVELDGNRIACMTALPRFGRPMWTFASIFQKSSEGWTFERHVHATDSAPRDAFGASLSLAGDRLLVGAIRHDAEALDGGAAYVIDLDR